ncbi:hypothetical protein Bbelb_055510 [Branchiostoma belcheri]|nr:hypothetical protein Bbelb_055510 [Branchiostoma belcheri]
MENGRKAVNATPAPNTNFLKNTRTLVVTLLPDETIKTYQENKDTQLDILILGDSNTMALKENFMYPNKSVRKELVFNLTECTEFIQRSKLPSPKVILFHVGAYDIRDTPDATTVSESFRKLIQTTHDKYPNSSIVMSSVLPIDHAPTLQDVGNDVNSFLKVVADVTCYVHTIDNSNFADSGTIKSALYSSDGYHINRFGIRVLAANIKRATDPLLGIGQYTGRKTQPVMSTVKNSQTSTYRDAVIGAPSKPPAQQPSHTSMTWSSLTRASKQRRLSTCTSTDPPVTGHDLPLARKLHLSNPTTPWRQIPRTPNQLLGPWCPPMFNQPAGTWGFSPPRTPGFITSQPRQPQRFNPQHWPRHPSMMYRACINK